MDDDYVAISVQWLPTMFYYTLYHCLQAYFAASGKPHTPTHTDVLRVITEDCGRFPAFMGSKCTSYFPNLTYESIQINEAELNGLSNLTPPRAGNLDLHIAKFSKQLEAIF